VGRRLSTEILMLHIVTLLEEESTGEAMKWWADGSNLLC
jgi:hypothetical protein